MSRVKIKEIKVQLKEARNTMGHAKKSYKESSKAFMKSPSMDIKKSMQGDAATFLTAAKAFGKLSARLETLLPKVEASTNG